MEDKKATERLKSFMQIKLSDPIKMWETYHVSLRKKRFNERSNIKRGIISKKCSEDEKNYCDEKLLANFDKHIITISEKSMGLILDKANEVSLKLVKFHDYTELKEFVKRLSELCRKDASNEICEELYFIQIILSNRNLRLTNDLIIFIIREINNVVEFYEDNLEVHYHAFNVLINLTLTSDIHEDYISDLMKHWPPLITQLLWLISNISSSGYSQITAILKEVDVGMILNKFIEGEWIWKVVQKYKSSNSSHNFQTDWEWVESASNSIIKISKYVDLIYILTFYSEEILDCSSNTTIKSFVELMKEQVIRIRNLLRLGIEDRDKMLSFQKKALSSLKGILVLNKIDPELREMIIDEDLLKDFKIILKQNDPKLIKEWLEIIAEYEINGDLYLELNFVSRFDQTNIQILISKIISIIPKQSYSQMVLMIESGLTDCLISYMESENIEVNVSAVIALYKIYHYLGAHLLPPLLIEKIVALLNRRTTIDLLRLWLYAVEAYLINDTENDEEFEISCAATFNLIGGEEAIKNLFEHKNTEIRELALKIYHTLINPCSDDLNL